MIYIFQNSGIGNLIKLIVRLLVFFFLLIYSFQANLIGSAGVIVEYFRVEGLDKTVKVEWKTNSEVAILGFYIQRSLSRDSGYARVSELIENQGVSPSGAEYEYLDADLLNGTTYWYKLEIIDSEVGSSFYGTQKSAFPDAQPTTIPTSTPIPPTQKPQTSATSMEVISPTTTSTTLPAYPDPEIPTLIPTIPLSTSSVDIIDVTATLIPLPSLTLNFPPTEEPDQFVLPETDISNSGDAIIQQWSKFLSTRFTSIIGLLLIWLVFAVLIIYFLRRLS